MTASSKRVKVPRGEARLHLEKARQFLNAAREALDGSLNDAAMLGAIHAGISAADAVTVSIGGLRSADPDHLRAAVLLEEVGGSEARGPARQLRQLVSAKSNVEYTSRLATKREASDAVKRATRLVDWASGVVDAATPR